ncbi:methyltransferase domain-containing protein [Desulfobotulus sp.]|uniref:methyltransferase domain-containing protein n=1 Tax=Desulfobotulus sp. TaxID=1940337 RepID=UPI002A367CBD|nr:methyltransferase domain-containing protein [Desulfobotulus sp.]MDY0163349.1 methyltransferase domain-containing protein [Desulfobotulus sp.]
MKERVAASFSAKAVSYEAHARVQRRAAMMLLEHLKAQSLRLPEGPVLEIGCGTGFVSRGLAGFSGDRELFFTDLAPAMVAACEESLRPLFPGVSMDFSVMDGEALHEENRFALLVSAFTLQWFSELGESLGRFAKALVPGGLLALSFQGEGSFSEWKTLCEEEKLSFSANPLPKGYVVAETLKNLGCRVVLQSGSMVESYPEPKYFFRALAAIGAGTSLSEEKRDARALSRLMAAWKKKAAGGPVFVTYRTHFILAFRPENPEEKGSLLCRTFPDVFL